MKGSALWILGMLSVVPAQAQDEVMAFPPPKVQVTTAEIRDMAPQVDVSGTVISLNDSRIAAEVEGVLISLSNVGDVVVEGDVIARIEPRLMQVSVRRAEADVARLEADLKYREGQLRRNEGLAANNNASANLLEESLALRDAARHQLTDARAQLERARGDLNRSQIRAPFAGHVAERLSAVGEYVNVGESVLRLVDTAHKEIALPAPIALTPYIRSGMQVAVRNGERETMQTVRTVVPVGDMVSRMVEVRLLVEASEWLVGTPVQVSLPRSEPIRAVAIPRDALVQRGGQSFVYRVNADGTAEQIVADIRATVGLWVAVPDQVEAGDRIVIRGGERLQPGQAVEVMNDPTSGPGE